MTADAPLDEHRANLRLEEGDPISSGLSAQPCARTSRDHGGGQQTVEVVPEHAQSFKQNVPHARQNAASDIENQS